jgi:hypothetical protein
MCRVRRLNRRWTRWWRGGRSGLIAIRLGRLGWWRWRIAIRLGEEGLAYDQVNRQEHDAKQKNSDSPQGSAHAALVRIAGDPNGDSQVDDKPYSVTSQK